MAEQHSLQLDEEEQLQLALALSVEEAREQGHPVDTTEDEALARTLQVGAANCAAGSAPGACVHVVCGQRS